MWEGQDGLIIVESFLGVDLHSLGVYEQPQDLLEGTVEFQVLNLYASLEILVIILFLSIGTWKIHFGENK